MLHRLNKYLYAVAKIFTELNLNLTWYPGNGMEVVQSYLKPEIKRIAPIMYSKSRINLQFFTDKLDRNKQLRSLMPNLIHSLDSSSLCSLYDAFSKRYKNNPQFYSVHDCFATTADKVEKLKVLLASVYTNLYLENKYLLKFDEDMIDQLNRSGFKVQDRKVDMGDDKTIELYDIN